jgi:hypothetical protein
MRPRAVLAVPAVAGVLCLAVGCAGGGPAPPHPARSAHAAASTTVIGGTPTLFAARDGYTKVIVPVYPLALRLATELVSQPAGPVPAAGGFAARLRQAESRLAAVTAFPGPARPAFARFRADCATVLRDLASATARTGPGKRARAARRRAARDLYALDHQIGVLGIGLGLSPGPGTN